MKNNEEKLKSAGMRMVLKLLPNNLLAQAPAMFEQALNAKLQEVAPAEGEAGVCFLLMPDEQAHMQVLTVALNEQNTVTRVAAKISLADIVAQLLQNLNN